MKKTTLTLIGLLTLSSCNYVQKEEKEEAELNRKIELRNIEYAKKQPFSKPKPITFRKGNTIRQYIDINQDGVVDEYKLFQDFAFPQPEHFIIPRETYQVKHFVLEGVEPNLSTDYKYHNNSELIETFPNEKIREELSNEMNTLTNILEEGYPKDKR